jgi:cytochrome c peroxidase
LLCVVPSEQFPAAQDKLPPPQSQTAASPDALRALREQVGQRLFFDTRLSEPAGVACASCHDSARAFSGDNGSGLPVARGSKRESLGTRNAPTLMYLATAPRFAFVEKEGKRVPVGGLFWDGRAATLEEQAVQPYFNPLEMNNGDAKSLVAKVAQGEYAAQFRQAWGADVFDDPQRALAAIGASLAAFQRSALFQPFTSKFDAVLRGQAKFNEQEERGFGLFTIRQKGNCSACHAVNVDSRDPRDSLFTDFSYHALGVARHTAIPANKDATFVDMGLCGPTRNDLAKQPDAKRWCGFFKVPTLRNIALTAPYMHNGRFDKLRDAVAFYATRDTNPERWYPDGAKFNDLPPELHANVDVETPPYHREGKRPALKDDEIDDIVAFLHTLTDGWKKD